MEEDTIVTIDDEDEDVSKETAKPWEKEIVWESLDQIPSGRLTNASYAKDLEFTKKLEKRRKLLSQKENSIIRRGLTRYMFLIIDMSDAMGDQSDNMRPSRMAVVMKGVNGFIREYFDQNPISQLGLVVTRNSTAEKITELSGNPMKHVSEFNKVASSNYISGEPSLQNALEVCRSTLSHVPKYGTREVLLVFAGLSTCDPGDIFETITALKRDSIRVSIIGLSAEMYLCRALSTGTHGSYMVAMNEEHFNELLFNHTPPPPAIGTAKLEASLVRMGFPLRRMNQTTNLKRAAALADEVHPSLCACHQILSVGGNVCPQCTTKFCDLPTDCSVCGLTLVSSPHLARSYHHLFPVPPFQEMQSSSMTKKHQRCRGCKQILPAPYFQCRLCHHSFCLDCDTYVHESLHNCPGCESIPR